MVIPQDIRRKMDLHKGRRLYLEFSEIDQTITLRAVGDPGSLRGFLKGSKVLTLRAEERRKELERDGRRSRK